MKFLLYSVSLVLAGLTLFTQASLKSSFGEACNKEKRCDSKALVTCSQEICQCLIPNTMIFDDTVEKCVALAGEKCVYTAVEGERTWTDTVPCVSNALCANGVCTCNPEYLEIANGTCEGKQNFGESCTRGSIDTCKADQVCGDSGRCECEIYRVYNALQMQCLILAGEKCQSGQNDGSCVSNATCNDELCSCESGYFKTSNGTCETQKSYGELCLTGEMCKTEQKLTCGVDGFCKCASRQVFDITKQSCLLGAGERCFSDSCGDEMKCTENSYCTNAHDGWIVGKCICKEGYFNNADGRCIENSNYGGICYETNHCIREAVYDDHNMYTFLECINGKCDCSTFSTKSSSISSTLLCGRTVGAACRGDICAPGSRCDYGNDKCECESGFYETSKKTCAPKKGYEEACEKNDECQENLFLSCDSNGACSCILGKLLNPISNLCVSRAGGSCRNAEACVPNSDCSGSSFQCICHPFTAPTLEGYCNIVEGRPCDSDTFHYFGNKTKTCFPGLHCINGLCSCEYKNHQKYNVAQMKCSSLVGGPCKKSDNCVDNADCMVKHKIKQCRCKPGFTSFDRVCDISNGEKCSQGESPVCDRMIPLECSLEGTCKCSGFQIYNNETQNCRGLVGAACNSNKKDFCVNGTTCRIFRSPKGQFGECICLPGLFLQGDRTCKSTEAVEVINTANTEEPL